MDHYGSANRGARAPVFPLDERWLRSVNGFLCQLLNLSGGFTPIFSALLSIWSSILFPQKLQNTPTSIRYFGIALWTMHNGNPP
jgi:hypothetical protein